VTRPTILLASLALCAAPLCAAAQDQSKSPDHFYRLNLAVEQLNDAGQVENTRAFVETIQTNHPAQQIRTGTRVPVVSGADDKGNTQFTYIDIGVSFDIRQVKEDGDKLAFDLAAEVSRIATPTTVQSKGLSGEPVIRQNKWDAAVAIPIGKPTVVFSSDDLDDKGTLRVEVTATRLE
jgi:hypothetical protein